MIGSRDHVRLETARVNAFRIPGQGTDRLKRFIDEVEAEFVAIQPAIEKAKKKLEEARAIQISRAEVMRIMRIIVCEHPERDYRPIFEARLSAIWNDPDFDEQIPDLSDPGLEYRAGGRAAFCDAFYYLLPDLVLAGLEKRVAELVPKNARGTLATRRLAVAAAEAELGQLERQASDLVSQYRMLLDDKLAIPGQRPMPEDERLIEPEMAEPQVQAQPSSRQSSAFGQAAARVDSDQQGIPLEDAIKRLGGK